VIRNETERLQNGFAVGTCTTYAFDHEDQAVQFVLDGFRLGQLGRCTGPAMDACAPDPFAHKKTEFSQRLALGIKVRHSGAPSHMGKNNRHRRPPKVPIPERISPKVTTLQIDYVLPRSCREEVGDEIPKNAKSGDDGASRAFGNARSEEDCGYGN